MLPTLEIKNTLDKYCDELGALLEATKYKKQYQQFMDKYISITVNDKLHLVLCGEWSTGKSTIVKALTGLEDIRINTDVETAESTLYEYKNNICIVDTPGFNSLNKEHTDRARDALLNSDRIIYCITASNLFGKKSICDFKEIIRTANMANPVILAVTKFAVEGNDSIESLAGIHSQIEDDLEKTGIASDYYTTCIFDAEKYIEGVNSGDDDVIGESYFTRFIDVIENPCENGKDQLSRNKCSTQTDLILKFISGLIDSIKQEFTDENKQKLADIRQKKQDELKLKLKELKSKVKNVYSDIIDWLNKQFERTEIDTISVVSEIEDRLCDLLKDIKDELPDKNTNSFTDKEIHITVSHTSPKKRSGFLSLFNKVKDKNNNGIAATIGRWAESGIKKVNEMAAPVKIGEKKARLFKKVEPIMSETGGTGTRFAEKFMKIFPEHGESMSMGIAKVSSKAGKFARSLPMIGVAVDTGLNIYFSVKENMSEKKINCLKSEFKRTVCEQLKGIKNDLNQCIDDYFADVINNTNGYADDPCDANFCLISDLTKLQQKIENISDKISSM